MKQITIKIKTSEEDSRILFYLKKYLSENFGFNEVNDAKIIIEDEPIQNNEQERIMEGNHDGS